GRITRSGPADGERSTGSAGRSMIGFKKYDAGACLAASFEGPDWSNQVMGPLLEYYLKIKKRREIWSRTRGSRQRLPTPSNGSARRNSNGMKRASNVHHRQLHHA